MEEMGESNLIKKILLIDKPKGLTSFDVIRVLRRKLGVRKMGHSGTLDPLATGLMLVGVGEGTKKLQSLIRLPKTYEASVLLGVRTATGDLEGEVLESKKIRDLDCDEVKNVILGLEGKIELRVPAYSAVKVGGIRLYKLARSGEKFLPPMREMEILKSEFKDCFKEGDNYIVKTTLEVSSGAYIRSIAEEIGRRLGLPAVLGDLRRTAIGKYNVKDANKLSPILTDRSG